MKNSNYNQRGTNKNLARSRNNLMTGIFFLIAGILLLARATGIIFPGWFFTWPVFLIGLGIFSGVRQKFRGGSWLILILIGGVFLADKISDQFYLRPYFWPILFLTIGAYIILGGRGRRFMADRTEGLLSPSETSEPNGTDQIPDYDNTTCTSQAEKGDVLDITSIFSGINKNVISKNFKGGEVVAIMGGAEVNLTKADIQKPVTIDMTAMFGGIKLFVPANWNVQSNMIAIFGGVDDKRPPAAANDPEKVIFLEGNCIFGGIEIRSY